MSHGLVLDVRWDADHLWSVPAGFQRVRFTVLQVVFHALGAVGTVVAVVLFVAIRDPRAFAALGALAFTGVALVVGAVGRRMQRSMTFACSRTRGYHDGERWHPWSEVVDVVVRRGLAHELDVRLVDGTTRRHLLGQVGYGRQTAEVTRLLPSFVPPDRLVTTTPAWGAPPPSGPPGRPG